MGLLDSNILSGIMHASMSPLYGDGTLHITALVDDGEGGWSESGSDTPIKVQVDVADQRMMAQPGYVGTDVRLLVLAHSGANEGNGAGSAAIISAITTDMEITAQGKRYMIMAVSRDPVGSYFECRGRVKHGA